MEYKLLLETNVETRVYNIEGVFFLGFIDFEGNHYKVYGSNNEEVQEVRGLHFKQHIIPHFKGFLKTVPSWNGYKYYKTISVDEEEYLHYVGAGKSLDHLINELKDELE